MTILHDRISGRDDRTWTFVASRGRSVGGDFGRGKGRQGRFEYCLREMVSSHVIGTGRFPKAHEMWHAVP